MTPEPDQISKLINQSPRVKTSLGFAVDDGEVSPREVMQVAVVRGRKRRINTTEGPRDSFVKARLIRTLNNGLEAIRGAEGSSIDIDDLSLLIGLNEKAKVSKALRKARANIKQNLQGK